MPGTKWTAERRAKFARTLKAKKKNGGRGQVRARTVRANGQTLDVSSYTPEEAYQRGRAMGDALIAVRDALEPLTPTERALALGVVVLNLAAS